LPKAAHNETSMTISCSQIRASMPDRAVLLALAPLLAAVLALFWLHSGLYRSWMPGLSYRYQIDAEEGFILDQALTLARGGSIYRPLDHAPFLVGNYTPLFPWIYGLLNGPRANPESLPLGRKLVQSSTLLAALGLLLIAGGRTRRLLPALLAPLVFLVSYETVHWSAFVRVDLPALALTLAGLACFLSIRRERGVVAAALLFVAAFFTRQTSVLAPLACLIALALHDRRRLIRFALTLAVAGGLAFLALQWASGGEFFRHVVTYNRNRMDWTALGLVLRHEVFFFYRWLMAAAVAGMLYLALRGKQAAPEARFRELPHTRHATAIYAALGLASLVSLAKVGSAPNYVLEPLAAGGLWLAETLGRLTDAAGAGGASAPGTGRRSRAPALAALAAAGLLTAVHAIHLLRLAPILFAQPAPSAQDAAQAHRALALVRQTPGDALCEEPIFNLLADKPVLHQPFIMAQLAREGKWDPAPLLAMIHARRCGVILTTEDLRREGDYMRYTPAMAEAVRAGYQLRATLPLAGLRRVYYLWFPADNLNGGPGSPR
jgi:hypothetical protein